MFCTKNNLKEVVLTHTSVNAGVRAQQGFALQRNMALFIILDNFKTKFEGAKYFLSIEHLEDIIFCFVDEGGRAVKVETYQSKKKTTGSWAVNKELAEIVVKMLRAGKSLIQDSYPKSGNYSHKLMFSSNSTMKLEKIVSIRVGKENKKTTYSQSVNEECSEFEYIQLDQNIKDAIVDKLEKINEYRDENLSGEINNLRFLYVDFSNTHKEQENQLRSKLEDIFDRRISDTKAALDSIFRLFREVELTYNQKSIARLSDKSKQVTSQALNEAIKIITTKSKAFSFWRDHKRDIAVKLGIRPFEFDVFEMKFSLAFDLFKSKEEAEHQKILSFVKVNYMKCIGFTEDDCIDELFSSFNHSHGSTLDEQTLKATIYAAYFESINKMDN